MNLNFHSTQQLLRHW